MPFPFAHASSLSKHVDSQVTVIGKTTEVSGNTATVDASGTIKVRVNAAMDPLENDQYYRFLGKVLDDSTLDAYDAKKITNVGDFDPEIARRVIDAQTNESPFY